MLIIGQTQTYDALLADAGSTMNQTQRLADFQKAENILLNTQAVIAPTYYQQFPVFTSKIIQGVQQPLLAPYDVEWKYAYTVGRK